MASAGRLTIRSGAVAGIVAELRKRMELATVHLQAKIQRNVSTPSRLGRSAPGGYIHSDSGRARNSVFRRVSADGRTGTVGTNLWYFVMLETGIPGGTVIRPTRAKALRWVGPGGVVFFRKKVVQGAIAARPTFARTLREERPALARIFARPMR